MGQEFGVISGCATKFCDYCYGIIINSVNVCMCTKLGEKWFSWVRCRLTHQSPTLCTMCFSGIHRWCSGNVSRIIATQRDLRSGLYFQKTQHVEPTVNLLRSVVVLSGKLEKQIMHRSRNKYTIINDNGGALRCGLSMAHPVRSHWFLVILFGF